MTTQMSRRSLLGGAAATGIGIALAGSFDAVAGTRPSLGYGDLESCRFRQASPTGSSPRPVSPRWPTAC